MATMANWYPMRVCEGRMEHIPRDLCRVRDADEVEVLTHFRFHCPRHSVI